MKPVPITFARGDGIGPEIMEAALSVLEAAGARLELHEIEIGQKVFERGFSSGIEPSSWETLRRTGVFFKSPITTPQGKGFKSLNVTTRKALGLYANVRPCVSYAPFTRSLQPGMDLIIIRENEEDTYAGIEYRQTQEVTQCLKLISRPGSEKIVRYAFEFAKRAGRKKLTCMSKDNIMKITDGLFHRVFDEVSSEYPEIETDHIIIDIGSALVAERPQMFDVIVTPNLYGDIISDIAAQVAGSVGLAGSANVGDTCAMFEAIHGSAPDIAGKGIANPSGLIQGAAMMLAHLDQPLIAQQILNAWLLTIEDGVHTADVKMTDSTKPAVGTKEFAQEVVNRLGQEPTRLKAVQYESDSGLRKQRRYPLEEKTLVGVDLFLDWDEAGRSPDVLAKRLHAIEGGGMTLGTISNRGVKVYPEGFSETFCSDHWRCRFQMAEGQTGIAASEIVALQARAIEDKLDVIKTENLYEFDGETGYSLGQGD